MKKFILIALFAIAGLAVNAQTNLLSQYGHAVDTVTNTATKYLTIQSPVGGYFKIASVSVTVTEISGTTAGSVVLQASLDGVNYYNIYTSSDSTYTFSPADVTGSQSYRFNIAGWADKYLRVAYTGAGTMSAKVQAAALFRN